MKEVIRVTSILFALFVALPVLGLWLTDHPMGSIIGLFVGLFILQYITRNGRCMSDADI